MTLKHAVIMCRAIGITLRKVDGEYQIKPSWAKWNHASVYFTDSLSDATDTASAMSQRWIALR